jgi:hypothetical protein
VRGEEGNDGRRHGENGNPVPLYQGEKALGLLALAYQHACFAGLSGVRFDQTAEPQQREVALL